MAFSGRDETLFMRASVLQLARLRGLDDLSLAFLTEALEATGGFGLDVECELDLEWARRFRALADAYAAVVYAYIVQSRLDAAASEREFALHMGAYWGLLRGVLRGLESTYARAALASAGGSAAAVAAVHGAMGYDIRRMN